MFLISVLYLLLSLLVIFCSPVKKTKKIVVLSMFVPMFNLMCAVIFFLANYFSGEGIDERLVFHVKMGMVGIDIADYWQLIIGVLLLIILFITLVYKLININNHRIILQQKLYSILLILLCFNPVVLIFIRMYGEQYLDRQYPENFTEYYSKLVKPTDKNELNKKYIIILYLESLEKSFYDESLFPNLMPYLKKTTENHLTFSNVGQVAGTGFTIGGIVSSQCGVPLLAAEQTGSSYQGVWNSFLGTEYCLGDFFKDSHYTNYFIGGADHAFAGKQKFFLSHGFEESKIWGAAEFDKMFKATSISPTYYRSQWGFYDEVVLDKILEVYSKNDDEKQYIIGLTLGTHHPGNLISPYCQKNFNNYDSVYLNILSCTDSNLEKFISAISDHPKAAETVLVLASDHLAMNNEFLDDLLSLPSRENLLTIIDFANPTKKTITTQASTLDTGATLLDYLNVSNNSVNLGRSLLNDFNKTLVEKFKIKTDRVLRSWSEQLLSEMSQVNVKRDSLSISVRETKIDHLTTNTFPLFITYEALNGRLINGLGGFDKHPLSGVFTDYYSIQLMYENLQSNQNNLVGFNTCQEIKEIFIKRTKLFRNLDLNGSICYMHIENINNDQLYIRLGPISENFKGSLEDLLKNTVSVVKVNKYNFLLQLQNLILNPQLFTKFS